MKAYQPVPSRSAMAIRYAFMNLTASCAACAMLTGKLRLHVSPDRLLFLTLLFNLIAVCGRLLTSLFADRVQDKHTGVRMAVMVFSLGILWPVEFGITLKVILAAVGTCLLHAFTVSSLLARSDYRAESIGLYAAGGAIGIAFARYAGLLGYLAVGFLMIFACPSDKSERLPDAAEKRLPKAPPTPLAPLFVLALLTVIAGGSYLFGSLSFSWDSGFHTHMMHIAFAIAIGRFLGGWLADRIGTATTVVGGLVGGTMLLLYAADNKLLALAGLILLSFAAAPTVMLVFRLMPSHPGFIGALASAAAYLGMQTVKLYPMKAAHFALFPLVTAVVTVGVSLSLFFLSRRSSPNKEVMPDA